MGRHIVSSRPIPSALIRRAETSQRIVMTFHKRLWIGLLLVGLAVSVGCSGQDPNQPAAGSISVGARKDSTAPNLPPGKAKTTPARGK
jgi:hypothetical protein